MEALVTSKLPRTKVVFLETRSQGKTNIWKDLATKEGRPLHQETKRGKKGVPVLIRVRKQMGEKGKHPESTDLRWHQEPSQNLWKV